ncbi:MAG: DsbA family protein [Alphaproteobacteria bacterium]|nr:DsbA family protein [Alphaproteobacteria bacterium]
MSRPNIILLCAVAAMAGALLASVWFRPAPAPTSDDIRAMIAEEIANADVTARMAATPAVDAATLDPMIESYLLANPSILEKMSVALNAERKSAELEQNRVAIAAIHDDIFKNPDHAVVGNPEGDVILVELFDYNCSYCRTAVGDLAEIIAADPDLKVVLAEFPILSQGSVEAARVAIAVNRAGADYWDFHLAMFTTRGQASKETALDAAEALGLDRNTISADADSDAVSEIIQKSYDIAQILSIAGTPAYIVGDEVVSGAVGPDALKERIANLRACGSTVCDG